MDKNISQADIISLNPEASMPIWENNDIDVYFHELQTSQIKGKILTGTLISCESRKISDTESRPVAVVDYKGCHLLIPIPEMNISLSASYEDEAIAELQKTKITSTMIGSEIDFIVLSSDEKSYSAIASRKKAMEQKIERFYKSPNGKDKVPLVHEGALAEARIVAVSEHMIRLEVFGVELFKRSDDLDGVWKESDRDVYSVGDRILVRISSIKENENGKISIDVASAKPKTCYPCKSQGKYLGKVVNVDKGIIFIRLRVGTNALGHYAEGENILPRKGDEVYFVCTRMDMSTQTAIGFVSRVINRERY